MELLFARALNKTINVIVYAELDNLIEINGLREVITDYSETMNKGYFVEQEMKFRVDCYEQLQLHRPYSDELGKLEDELEQVLHLKIRSVCDDNGEL